MSTAVEVIEVARDFGPKRTMAKADAAVAQATVPDRIADSRIDTLLKVEELRQAQLRTKLLEQEVADRRQALSPEDLRRVLVDRAIRRGQLDVADALRALDASDLPALGQLGQRSLEFIERSEPDEDAEP